MSDISKTPEFFFFRIAVYSGILYQADVQLFFLFKIVSVISGCIGLTIYFIKNGKTPKSTLLNLWLALMMYLFLIGFLYRFPSFPQDIYTFLCMDLSYIVFMTIGIVLAEDIYLISINRLMKEIVFITIVFQLLAIVWFDNTVLIEDRNVTITSNNYSYTFWNISSNVAIFCGISFFYNILNGVKYSFNSVITSVCFILYVVIGLSFQKRAPLINTLSLFVISYIIFVIQSRTKLPALFFRIVFFILIFGLILVYLYHNYDFAHTLVDQTRLRFTDEYGQNGSLTTYDRQREADEFIERTEAFQIITGYGVGNYVATSMLDLHGMLHIGYYNMIYKGGIFYMLFLFYIFSKTLQAFLHSKTFNSYDRICLGITISIFVSMIYEFSWGETIMPVCYFPFIGHICKLNFSVAND